MTSAAGIIHIVAGNNFVFYTKVVECHHIFGCLTFECIEIFYRKYVIVIPLEFQARPILYYPLHVGFVQ